MHPGGGRLDADLHSGRNLMVAGRRALRGAALAALLCPAAALAADPQQPGTTPPGASGTAVVAARPGGPPAPAEPPATATPPMISGETTSFPQPPPPVVAPIPTADATPAASDHDAVVGHLGIEARHVDPGPLPLTLRPGFGCPSTAAAPCEISVGALVARYWTTRNLAWNGGLALAVGGGRAGTETLDTYLGVGPIFGFTLLLGNWRHLSVGASPELGVIWFRPRAHVSRTTTIVNLRAALEAELHFGFVGVPALSLGVLAGLGLQYESAPDARVWSLGVVGAGSIWGMLSNLFVRYYL